MTALFRWATPTLLALPGIHNSAPPYKQEEVDFIHQITGKASVKAAF